MTANSTTEADPKVLLNDGTETYPSAGTTTSSSTQANLQTRYETLAAEFENLKKDLPQPQAQEVPERVDPPSLATMVAEWVPKKKVLLATPSNRGLNTQYVASMLNTMGDQRGMDDQVQIQPYLWPGESLISRARNDILRYFYYESDCTHLFFVDDDIAWEPVCFYDILAAEKDIVGGIYPLKSLRWDQLVGKTIESEQQAKMLTMEVVVNGVDPNHPDNDGALLVAHDLGTGFLCISREAITKMILADPDDWYASNARNEERKKTLDFFGLTYDGEKGTMSATLLSEDYAFCRKAQAAGIKTYVHTGIPLLVHIGQHTYGRIVG